MMNKLNVGEELILDKGFKNSYNVFVVSQTPKLMFTTITTKIGSDDTWEVMTRRLTKIEK